MPPAFLTRSLPSGRVAGAIGLAAAAVVHNVVILERYSTGNVAAITAVLAAWAALSWLVLRHRDVGRGRLDLGLGVELGDVVVWTLVIYLTGGERSLLVFLVLLPAADRRGVTFRRVLLVGHFSIACYVLLLAYVALVDRPLAWPDEVVKVSILYAANLYLTSSARAAEALRVLRRRSREAQTSLLANVSHELRTPLNGVIGGTRLLEASDLTPAQRHHLTMVRSSAEAMLGVAEEILDFSKLEARKLTIEPIVFSLRATLAESVRPLAPRADTKGLALRVRLAADVPDALVGDPVRLRQIVVNLVANAIKFTEDGEVELLVTLEPGDADGVLLHLAVRDTGIGIAADRRQAVFEPFTQAEGSTTRTHGGTGLGLTIASRLCELMGGRLWLQSDLGHGSTFHATVRCQSAPPRTEPAAPWLIGRAALVAEPDAGHRATLVDMLHAWGLVTTQAEAGDEVLRTFARGGQDGRPFDILFIGIDLIALDGLRVVERLQAMPHGHVPVVMLMRAMARRGDRERCAELGVRTVLMRPFSQFDVFDALRVALEQAPATPARGPRRRLSILVADDDPVNREVATEYLVGWGHAVTPAADGIQALALLERGHFDAAMLDVHMPGADGFEVTRNIRRREATAGGRLPVVAMTARALDGDGERCREAGMDAYVAKPVDASQLFDTVERVTAEGDRLVFGAALLERAGGDAVLQQRITSLFLAHVPDARARLREAVVRGDAAAVVEGAHWLKSAVGNFPAPVATEAAAVVEKLARAGNVQAAGLACRTLEVELDRLTAALAAVTAGLPEASRAQPTSELNTLQSRRSVTSSP